VQVGANDGRFGDPVSKFILDNPWRGILVEPLTDVFARLRENYAAAADRLVFENVAISRTLSELVLYRAPQGATPDNVYASTVASVSPEKVAMQLGLPVSALETVRVPCMTLDALLAKHGWTGMDVLLLDTEGHDYEVLQSIDLARFRPLVVQFEHGHLTPAQVDGACQVLARAGYRILYGGYQIDSVAIHEDFWEVVAQHMGQVPAT
jgi:FkbM family methyltransferase